MKCSEWDSNPGPHGLQVQHPNHSATLPPPGEAGWRVGATRASGCNPRNPTCYDSLIAYAFTDTIINTTEYIICIVSFALVKVERFSSICVVGIPLNYGVFRCS